MVGSLQTCTTTWELRWEPFYLPFLSSLHIDPLSYCHSKLLKYTDDFLLCYSYSKCSGQEWLDDDLHRRVTWSADDGLLINKSECVQCFFFPKNISLINGEALSQEQMVRYLAAHLTSNLTWSTHIDSVFTKCLKTVILLLISFSLKKLFYP